MNSFCLFMNVCDFITVQVANLLACIFFEIDIDALLTVKIDLTAFGFKLRAFAFS